MTKLLTLTAMLGLVGCVGDLGPVNEPGDVDPPIPPPPDGTTARAAFESDVYSIIDTKCIGCHENGATKGGAPATSGFVGSQLSGAYDIIVDYPNVHGNFASTAKLLTYVTQQGHQGIAYTDAEAVKIQNWLALELAERANNPQPPGEEGPGAVTARLLGEFSACMTQQLLDQANFAVACGDMDTTNNQECKNCHVNGGEGFVASDLSSQMFTLVSQHSSYLQKYFMVANAETPATAKIDRNLPMFQAVLSGTVLQYNEHPRKNEPTNNECTQAMQLVVTSVQQQIDTNLAACGPSKLID